MLRRSSRQVYRTLHGYRRRDFPAGGFAHSAVVFSPHYDDEVLGCGGTIIRKRNAGAEVKLVFMTDGSKSHRHLMDEGRLSTIRARECIAAAAVMGVGAGDITRLNLEETCLEDYEAEAVSRVVQLLDEFRPRQVFLPFVGEPLLWSHDHVATTRIVHAALLQLGEEVEVYEYPVWFWSFWPWAVLPTRGLRPRLRLARNSFSAGVQYFRDLTCSVDISGVLEQKREALAQYESQMTQLLPDERWATLGGVAGGQFLPYFFQDYELFYRRESGA